MEKLKTLLVANKGASAVRIIRTAKSLGIKTISIYTSQDAASQHVLHADESVLLLDLDGSAYSDRDAIVAIAKAKQVDAVIAGDSVLSQTFELAEAVTNAGLQWVGPSSQTIAMLGNIDFARSLAESQNVPLLPRSTSFSWHEHAAANHARAFGYPVMPRLIGPRNTAGLGISRDEGELRRSFQQAKEASRSLIRHEGWLERHYPVGRKLEVPVFGNGKGKVVYFVETESTTDRLGRKLISECPSPVVSQHPELRGAIGPVSASIMGQHCFASAGSVEWLFDEASGYCFFVCLHPYLPTDHGVTEMVHGIDLVELMLRQADSELCGQGGLDKADLEQFLQQHTKLAFSAIEAHVYVENVLKNFGPASGVLQRVFWSNVKFTNCSRIDTWVSRGTIIPPNYNGPIAKVMCNSSSSRAAAISAMDTIFLGSEILGPPTNIGYLQAIIGQPEFAIGRPAALLRYSPPLINVVTAGDYTLIVDYPGRPLTGNGIPTSGPMDENAFHVANLLVGNELITEGLEVTAYGPELYFLAPAIIALCGAPMEFTISDGGLPTTLPMWSRLYIKKGQFVSIGKRTGGGYRAYLAIYGGLPDIAVHFGSKSTSPVIGIGGYQGRPLVGGDVLGLVDHIPTSLLWEARLPERLIPDYPNSWDLLVMPGPQEADFLFRGSLYMICNSEWQVADSIGRISIGFRGRKLKWASDERKFTRTVPDTIDYAYPPGAVNWTAEGARILTADCPSFGGGISLLTVIEADWAKLGQLAPGDKFRFHLVSMHTAVHVRKNTAAFIDGVDQAINWGQPWDSISALVAATEITTRQILISDAIIPGRSHRHMNDPRASQDDPLPLATYRQGGDGHIIVEYGRQLLSLQDTCKVMALEAMLRDKNLTPKEYSREIFSMVKCASTLKIHFNSFQLCQEELVHHLETLNFKMGDLSGGKFSARRYRLPICLGNLLHNEAGRIVGTYAAAAVGPYGGETFFISIDPRQSTPSDTAPDSPSNTAPDSLSNAAIYQTGPILPASTVTWSSKFMSIASPGAPQDVTSASRVGEKVGHTLPIFDLYGVRPGFTRSRPSLFQHLDLLTFYSVDAEELNVMLARFEAGSYEFECEVDGVELDLDAYLASRPGWRIHGVEGA